MRLRQLGHQVPRRNSTIRAPRESRSTSENDPSPFADGKVNAGACDPTFSVSVSRSIYVLVPQGQEPRADSQPSLAYRMSRAIYDEVLTPLSSFPSSS